MDDINEVNEVDEVNELDLLKARAKQMGINFHPSIGVKKLRNKVSAKQKGISSELEPEAATSETNQTMGLQAPAETRIQRANRLRKEASTLVRIRVSCMNPDKREWPGEVYTVSNSIVGTFKKFVPFNAENGWHVPWIIFQHMKERECQIFHTVRNDRGQKVRMGKLIKELNIEVLPDLTPEQLAKLAQRQAMAAGTTQTTM